MTGNRIRVRQPSEQELLKDYPSPSAAAEAFAKAEQYFTETGKEGSIELLNAAGQSLAKRVFKPTTTDTCDTTK